jgi:hypothetical protein
MEMRSKDVHPPCSYQPLWLAALWQWNSKPASMTSGPCLLYCQQRDFADIIKDINQLTLEQGDYLSEPNLNT